MTAAPQTPGVPTSIRESPLGVITTHRGHRQIIARDWAVAAFTAAQARSPTQRGLRHAEEAIEAAQAVGVDPAQLHALSDYIYARPPGGIARELGGSGLTLLLLADAVGMSADACERTELARVLAKPRAHFTARNDLKNSAGFIADGIAEIEAARLRADTEVEHGQS